MKCKNHFITPIPLGTGLLLTFLCKPFFALVFLHGFINEFITFGIDLGQFSEGFIPNKANFLTVLKKY